MTSEEFHTKMKGFAKLNPQMMFVIESNPKEDQARQEKARASWIRYLNDNDLKNTLGTWKFVWNGGGKAITVPSEDPRNFDLKYHPASDAPRRAYGARGQARDISEPNTYRSE